MYFKVLGAAKVAGEKWKGIRISLREPRLKEAAIEKVHK